MAENKTIFNYIAQVFATYGITVTIFVVFSITIGENASRFSTLYSLGSRGLSIHTLIQLLVLALIITIVQVTFLTDKWIKNMRMIFRNVMFFALVCLVIAAFAVIFQWFPIDNVLAWIGFFVSFMICTIISVFISRMEENAENKKMEQALKKIKED